MTNDFFFLNLTKFRLLLPLFLPTAPAAGD
jgi:hypothetical protein